MTKANQHFVPRVYLKRWSPNATKNVFYYKKNDISVGEQRNVGSILYKRHTYTVAFYDYFILDYMPEVKKDFLRQIENILNRYDATVFIDNTEINIKNISSLSKALSAVENWEFRKKGNTEKFAPKKAIMENIKKIHSYKLETALDDYIEKKWNNILDDFIFELKIHYFCKVDDEDIPVSATTIEGIVSILLLFMCRNPSFDCHGIFPWIEQMLSSILLEGAKNEEQKKCVNDFLDRQMRGAWLSQVYKALFEDDTSFFIQCLNRIKESCQVTIMHSPENNGSFITSDNPAFLFDCKVTELNYNAIYFPLTPQYLLMIGKGQPSSLNKVNIKTLSNKGVRKFNNIIFSKAKESIISNKKSLSFIL